MTSSSASDVGPSLVSARPMASMAEICRARRRMPALAARACATARSRVEIVLRVPTARTTDVAASAMPRWTRPSRIAGVANEGIRYIASAALTSTPPTTRTWRVPIAAAMTTIGSASVANGSVAGFPVPTLIQITAMSANSRRAVSSVGDRRARARDARAHWTPRYTSDGMTTAIALPRDASSMTRAARTTATASRTCGSLASRLRTRRDAVAAVSNGSPTDCGPRKDHRR